MRYVIKHPTLGYFTEFEVAEQRPIVAPMEMVIHAGHPPVPKGALIGQEHFYRPKFKAFKPSQATQFDTAEDAQRQIANLRPDGNPDEHMGGASAFAGCTVEESK
jgi:hypothetical protein